VNCAKHSGARTVRVRLGLESGRLVLEIMDDGCGFDVDKLGQDGRGPGHGLLNMRDRSAFAGGTLRIDSQPGAGTRIRVEVPCVADTDERAPDAPSR
jgi:two-component system sensor histidine kinase UhpB